MVLVDNKVHHVFFLGSKFQFSPAITVFTHSYKRDMAEVLKQKSNLLNKE